MAHLTLPAGRPAPGWQCNPPPTCPAPVRIQHARPLTCRRAFAELTAEPAVAQQDEISRLQQLRLITAIKTPYLPSGKFDLRAYDRLVQHQVENGVEGLVIGGTTGEGQLMSWDEHVMLIAHTVNAFGDRLAVIGNTGSNSTREALHATEQGFAVGMHASLQINPYYGKTSRTGLMAHFTAVLQEGPAIIYNVPGRTGQDIPDDVILQLASNHRSLLGVKECTGNARIANYARQGIKCWSGNDDEAHAARHQHDAQGVISVASNIIPGLYAHMMREQDDSLSSSLEELVAWLFCEPNPIAINTALAMVGLTNPVFRLPYVPLSRDQRQHGAELLRKVLPHLPGAGSVNVLEDEDFKLVARY